MHGLGPGVCLERGAYSYRLEHGWWTPAMLAISLIGWSGAACGSQNCLAAMQAITAEVKQRMLPVELPSGADSATTWYCSGIG